MLDEYSVSISSDFLSVIKSGRASGSLSELTRCITVLTTGIKSPNGHSWSPCDHTKREG